MQHPIRWNAASAMLVCSCLAWSSAAAPSCLADLDSSGIVNGIDLANLLGQWTGSASYAPCPPYRTADVNQNCIVNGIDLAQLLGAWGPCPKQTLPTITYTPVMFQGTPAPGISFPGAFVDYILTPQIDGEGNILFLSFIGAPGLGEVGNMAIFYGQPGHINKLIWETDPAPGMAPGVIIKRLFNANERLCEAGIVTFGAQVQGPGITVGVNDMAIFRGDPRIPGSIHKIIQTGEQAPGLDPGITLKYDSDGSFFGTEQSDNGTMLFFSRLAGPGVTYNVNDYAWWTGTQGTPGGLQLVWRQGMHAPGTPPGVTFTWADFFSVNNSGQIAFRGSLDGPGISDGVNNSGRWIGGPGTLQVYTWTGMPAPGLPLGATFGPDAGSSTCINPSTDMYTQSFVRGPGITSANDLAMYAGPPGQLSLIAREGDAVPEAGADLAIDLFTTAFFNSRREVFYGVKLKSPSIVGQSVFAAFMGPFDAPTMIFLHGDPAPHMPDGTILTFLNSMTSLAALNDVGDLVTATKIAGPGVTPNTDVVLWLHRGDHDDWWPLVRSGDLIGGKVVSIPEPVDLSGAYWQLTGGSDGFGLGFNDSRQLVLTLTFTDSSRGIFVISVADSAQSSR